MLVVHAAPGSDDGLGISVNCSDAELSELLAGADADLVLVGHTHIPFDRTLENIRIVNPGSVSNPFPPDLRASYAILEAGESGYSISHCRSGYDSQAFIQAVRDVRHPAADYIIRFVLGENKKDWME